MQEPTANRRATGVTGLLVVALFGAGNALWALDQPSGGAPAREVMDFYADGSTRIVVGASLSIVAIALFVVFASGLRAILREHEPEDVLPMAAFGGALLAMAAGFGAEGVNMVGGQRAGDGTLDPDLARSLFEISYVLGYNAAGAGIGLMVMAVAAVALRADAIVPRAVAIALLLLGAAMLTPLSVVLLPVSVLVLAAFSVAMLRPPSRGATTGAA